VSTRYLKDRTATGGATGGAAAEALKKKKSPVLKIKVTEEIISQSIRKNSGWCMVSEAVKTAAPWAKNVASDLQTIRLTDPRKGLRYSYLTPRTAQNALILFDQGKSPPPFKFTLGGAHISTSYKRTHTPDGKVQVNAVHKLGRRRIIPDETGQRKIQGTIGGRAAPRIKANVPSGTFRREFGLRAYKNNFDLDEMDKVQVPVGAPSLSDR
jgi:hypothetical protein